MIPSTGGYHFCIWKNQLFFFFSRRVSIYVSFQRWCSAAVAVHLPHPKCNSFKRCLKIYSVFFARPTKSMMYFSYCRININAFEKNCNSTLQINIFRFVFLLFFPIIFLKIFFFKYLHYKDKVALCFFNYLIFVVFSFLCACFCLNINTFFVASIRTRLSL